MAIISANRLSKLNGNYVIAANENYGVDDMGRILIENEMNDMAIFNAILKTDMYEMKQRNEGTMLESELRSLSENAIQNVFRSIIEKLKKFWAKMKGWFKKAYAMITAYCVRNGKAFLAANKKALSEINDKTKIKGDVYVSTPGFEKSIDLKAITGKDIVDIFKASTSADDNRSDMTKAFMKWMPYMDGYDGEKSVKNYLKDKLFVKKTDPTLGECGGKTTLMADLESGTKPLKKMKETERALEKEVKTLIKECETKARNAAKDLEGAEKDAKEKEVEYYRVGSTAVTNAMGTYTRAMISMVKHRLAQERIILSKAIVASVGESTLLASMIIEAAEDMEELEDSDAENLTPDEEEAVKDILDALDVECDGECKSDDDTNLDPSEGCKK